jgi:hypothetical protein
VQFGETSGSYGTRFWLIPLFVLGEGMEEGGISLALLGDPRNTEKPRSLLSSS